MLSTAVGRSDWSYPIIPTSTSLRVFFMTFKKIVWTSVIPMSNICTRIFLYEIASLHTWSISLSMQGRSMPHREFVASSFESAQPVAASANDPPIFTVSSGWETTKIHRPVPSRMPVHHTHPLPATTTAVSPKKTWSASWLAAALMLSPHCRYLQSLLSEPSIPTTRASKPSPPLSKQFAKYPPVTNLQRQLSRLTRTEVIN